MSVKMKVDYVGIPAVKTWRGTGNENKNKRSTEQTIWEHAE